MTFPVRPTKEFKDKLIKMANQFAETSKLNIRGARRTAMDKLKKLKLPEDENRTAEKEVSHSFLSYDEESSSSVHYRFKDSTTSM